MVTSSPKIYSLGTTDPSRKFCHALMIVINAVGPILKQLPIVSTAELFCGEEGVAQDQRGAVEYHFPIIGISEPATIALFEIFNKFEAKLVVRIDSSVSSILDAVCQCKQLGNLVPRAESLVP
jgi:hypothetical protein